MAKTFELGYKPVLIREETKVRLQQFRKGLDDRDLMQERRLASAAIEYALSSEEGKAAMIELSKKIVLIDINED